MRVPALARSSPARGRPVLAHGTDELRQRVLPPVVAGGAAGELLPLGAQRRQRRRLMTTRAVRDGDQWVLNGRKAWITSAGVSHVYTVSPRPIPPPVTAGISAFVVERPARLLDRQARAQDGHPRLAHR